MRFGALLVPILLVGLLSGCTGAPQPEPTPKPVPSPAQTPVREEIPGGFRLGPLDPRADFHWVGSERVWFGALSESGDPVRGMISLAGGGMEPDTELDMAYDPWHYLRSPDGLRAVAYSSKGTARRFVNRKAGTEAEPGLPDFLGSSLFDSWAPDSSYFLVQSVRNDPVPGFYLLDRDGRVAASFAEPGFFSHLGVWSPDGRKVAFLSVPLDVTYPHSPEEWEEPPFGERVGILDLETGEAKYLALEGYSFSGFPVWAEDGSELAVFCGQLETYRLAPPYGEHESTRLRDPRICVLDPAAGNVTPAGDPLPGEPMLRIPGIAPDAVLVGYWVDSGQRYGWVPRDGGPLLPMTEGEPVLVTGGLAAVVTGAAPDRLVLVNPQGEEVRTLAEGDIRSLTVSPDRTHVAFMHNGYLTVLAVGPDSAAHGASPAQGDERVHNSDLIVVATVSDQSQFSPIAASTALDVERAIKGTLPDEPVTIFQLGAPGDAGVLQKGMRYVLFLGTQTDSEPSTFFVKGGHEGVFFASAGTLHGPEKLVGDLQLMAGSDPLEALEQAVQTIMALQPA